MAKYKSAGVVVGKTPRSSREQRFDHLKGSRVTVGVGAPRSAEGAVGNITVRELPTFGLRCYIKTGSGWVDINSMVKQETIEWKDMILATNISHDTAGITPQYGKDSNGFVHFRGLINIGGGTETITITTLPPGYRPPKDALVPGCHASGVLVYKIDTDGVLNAPGNTVASDVSLDGVLFFAWQASRVGSFNPGGGGIENTPESGGHAPG
tara:strand:+ start:1787 stop:2416 length:630 start_codon:yes stop_codon:yes gene_type:complete